MYSFYEKWCNTTVEGENEHVLSEEELNTLSDFKTFNDSIYHPITHVEITKCINTYGLYSEQISCTVRFIPIFVCHIP